MRTVLLVALASIATVFSQEQSKFFKPNFPLQTDYPQKMYGVANAENQEPLAMLIGQPSTNEMFVAAKRNAHRMQARAVSQFKNCYFSPVQCVLLDRRRRSVRK
ncbi:unnamed protein product [Bursaphelenchus okinawaensis]|uniref:Uncharacterized protein n=1 Tax=Bursaphelenchus okinawaensis TaxID=465554 RepID=A0A811KYY0_9BILA|nr:unnamed protein product [Bursaphelenchus okinawaensis]CAG9114097.1 unnamed protein product [Bursaphelenchus okinawaensis]